MVFPSWLPTWTLLERSRWQKQFPRYSSVHNRIITSSSRGPHGIQTWQSETCLFLLQHRVFTVIHKHYQPDDWKKFATENREALEVSAGRLKEYFCHLSCVMFHFENLFFVLSFLACCCQCWSCQRRLGKIEGNYWTGAGIIIHLRGCSKRLFWTLCGIRQGSSTPVSQPHDHGALCRNCEL